MQAAAFLPPESSPAGPPSLLVGCTGQGSHARPRGLGAGVVMSPEWGGAGLISVQCCTRSRDGCRATQGTFMSAGAVRATSPQPFWDLSTPAGRGEGPFCASVSLRCAQTAAVTSEGGPRGRGCWEVSWSSWVVKAVCVGVLLEEECSSNSALMSQQRIHVGFQV